MHVAGLKMPEAYDVTDLVEHSKRTDTKFYINFLYLLSKVLNLRDDYRMDYLYNSDELICYDVINPCHYSMRIRRRARPFIPGTARITAPFIKMRLLTWKLQRKIGIISSMIKSIRIGLTHHIFRGFLIIRLTLNCRTGICIFLR